MAKRASKGKINDVLSAALTEELAEVRKRWKEDGEEDGKPRKKGEFIHGAVERMRVIDRCLKHQSILLNTDDSEFGSAFGKTKKGDSDEE